MLTVLLIFAVGVCCGVLGTFWWATSEPPGQFDVSPFQGVDRE